MGFVIWYAVELTSHGVPVATASNDVFAGGYVLDADITLEMTAGGSADTLTVELTNLPAAVAERLKAAQASKPAPGLEVKVHLGYFDEPSTSTLARSVLEGVVTSVKSSVSDGGALVTRIRGLESAGYKLLSYCVKEDRPGAADLDAFVREIADKAGRVGVQPGAGLGQTRDYTLLAGNGLTALRQIAGLVDAPLVVRDGKIFIGNAVGTEPFGILSRAKNIVTLTRQQQDEEEPDFCSAPAQPPPARTRSRAYVDLKVLGHPDLRVGKTAKLQTGDPADAAAGPLRINHVVHRFSTKSGYTCDVALVAAKPGEPAAESARGAPRVVRRVLDVVERANGDRPAIDVGQVASYEAGEAGKHLATLDYGHPSAEGAVAPSVETPVGDRPKLHSKPIAAPFAFHNCGLVVPVYPKMRALLAHNQGLVNDAVVSGFLWAENPQQGRPKSKPGDWWLCLPTGLDGDGLPTGKGVNDLTDAAGLRVIQAKGLRIQVADDDLPAVGARPALPDANTIVIEHGSGTKVTIGDDGAVVVETDGKSITFKTGGSQSVTIDGSKVAVSGLSMEVG
jgi:hypothetical protein